ncbi:FAST kinase domain-containing protein 5, partial [Orchesella cincta]
MNLLKFYSQQNLLLKQCTKTWVTCHNKAFLNVSRHSVLPLRSGGGYGIYFQIRPMTRFPYRHHENMNGEKLLRSLPGYKHLLFEAPEEDGMENCERAQVSQGSASKYQSTTGDGKRWRDSVNTFIETAYSCQDELPITHPKIQEVIENVLADLKWCSDDELCQVLYHVRYFLPCPSSKDPAFMKVWSRIDEECLLRHPTWSLDFCFVVADLWYGISLARFSQFHWTLIKKLFRKVNKLSKEHFVRFMFCLNLNREMPDNSNPYDLEYSLYKLVDQLSAEEVVVIAMAFFKTQTHIRDPQLMKALMHTVMKTSDSLDSISVAAVAKLTRFCTDTKSAEDVWQFQEKFIPEIPKLSIAACTHLALSGTNSLSPNQELIQRVVDRLEENMEEARLKELERISLAMTMYNADCDKLCNMIADELQKPERADEIRKYGRCLPAILHFLSIRNILHSDLISMCLSKEFRDTYYGRGKEIFQREILCLDVVADLEIPTYNGNRLGEKSFNLIMKKNMMRLKSPTSIKVSLYQKCVFGVTDTVQLVMRDKSLCHSCGILPHHHTVAIVVCTNSEGHFVKVPQHLTEIEAYKIKKISKNDTNLTYHAIVIMGRNSYLFKSRELTGQSQLQIRQTQKLGYRTHMVHYQDWDSLRDEEQRKSYINNILKNCSE